MEEPQSPWLTIETHGGLYRPKVDAQKMALALFHTSKNIVTGHWTGIAADAEETFKALGLKPEPAALAGFLLQRATVQAIGQIIAENRFRFDDALPDEKQTIAFFAREYLSRSDTPLNKDFFQKPQTLPFLAKIAPPFRKWLVTWGVPEPEAHRLAHLRLPHTVPHALSEEWRKNADFYKPLLTTETPFQLADEREYDWAQYRLSLQTAFAGTPLFDEDFPLADVYVPLRAYLETRPQNERTAYVRDSTRIRHVSDLETTVAAWLQPRAAAPARQQPKPPPGQLPLESPLCVLSGGPGSGKSSFCKKLAARLAEEGRHVLLIPLHHFTLKGDIPASIDSCIAERLGFLNHKPMENRRALFARSSAPQTPLVLLFDGLDELASQGRASQEAARAFLSALKEFLRDENAAELRVQALVSGRELVLQTHDTELTGRPLLHLLPYFLTKEEINQQDFKDPNHLLLEDQRDTWWAQYSQAKGLPQSRMPAPLKRDDLREITEQPLLNYLLALSFQRGTIDFQSETNLNVIYADLLRAVYDKRWGGEKVHIAGLGFEDFAAVMEETGLAVWHTDGRAARLPDIQQRCAGLPAAVLQKFAEGAEQGVMRLLTAFYIRKTDAYDAPTFEFTHKSFGEYLTARRLVSGLYDIKDMLTSRRGRRTEKAEEKALVEWARLFGPTPLDPALLRFLRNEVAQIYHTNASQNTEGKADIEAFQQILCDLIDVMLREGMPMHHTDLKLTTYQDMDRHARNAEEALLAMLNACARLTQKVSDITWSDKDDQNAWTQPERAGTWLRRLCGQRIFWDSHTPIAWNCLGWLNLSSCQLTGLDLRSAELQGVNLHGAELHGAALLAADLQRADLRGANLQGAELVRADLRGADLQEADLLAADVQWTDLQGADLHAARHITYSIGFDKADIDSNQKHHFELLEQWRKAHDALHP